MPNSAPDKCAATPLPPDSALRLEATLSSKSFWVQLDGTEESFNLRCARTLSVSQLNAIEVLLAEVLPKAQRHEDPPPPGQPVAMIYLGPMPDGRVLILDANGDGWLRTADQQLKIPLGVGTVEKFLGVLQSESTPSDSRAR